MFWVMNRVPPKLFNPFNFQAFNHYPPQVVGGNFPFGISFSDGSCFNDFLKSPKNCFQV